MNSVSEQRSDFIQDLGNAVRKNPVSAALIGMGVLWLFTGNPPVERASDFARFRPWLERVIRLSRESAAAVDPAAACGRDELRLADA